MDKVLVVLMNHKPSQRTEWAWASHELDQVEEGKRVASNLAKELNVPETASDSWENGLIKISVETKPRSVLSEHKEYTEMFWKTQNVTSNCWEVSGRLNAY